MLSCNFDKLESSTCKLNNFERVLVREFYERLVSCEASLRKGLKIYINCLLFNPKRQYDYCGYHLSLLQFHFQNSGGVYEVQPCVSMSKVDYIDALDTFLLSNVGTDAFFNLYPNLRIIVLDNTNYRRPISSPKLLSVLGLCTGLTELELRFAHLLPYFYSQMVQLPSLTRLHSLVIFELPGEFKQPIDLVPIVKRFASLRNFRTNLATRLLMLQLLEQIKIGDHFIFDFWIQEAIYHRCIVLRRRDTYNLLVEMENDKERGPKELHRRTFTSVPFLLKNLSEVNPKFPLHHWLDDVPRFF